MRIDWWTLVLQAVNFLVLVWLLSRFLYRPVKKIIEKRKALAEEAFTAAAAREREAEAARRRLEEAHAGLSRERQNLLRQVHEELESERRMILEEAKGKAETILQEARESLAGEREAVLTEVREQVAAMAVDLASSLLRQSGPHADSAVFLEQLEGQLADMAEDERERLLKDLESPNARLRVVTATPLSPQERRQWNERLSARLGLADKTDFTTDPEILGGAELHFPHAVLRFTWADQLSRAKEVLQRDEAAT